MKKNKKSVSYNLDHEEKQILASFEKEEWKPIKNVNKEKAMACQVATEYLDKRKS